MTNEEKRIAIAEACGWKRRMKAVSNTFNLWLSPNGTHEVSEKGLPDYFNDLNAMHEAEKTLGEADSNKFDIILCREFQQPRRGANYFAWHATAAQRADAFIEVISK